MADDFSDEPPFQSKVMNFRPKANLVLNQRKNVLLETVSKGVPLEAYYGNKGSLKPMEVQALVEEDPVFKERLFFAQKSCAAFIAYQMIAISDEFPGNCDDPRGRLIWAKNKIDSRKAWLANHGSVNVEELLTEGIPVSMDKPSFVIETGVPVRSADIKQENINAQRVFEEILKEHLGNSSHLEMPYGRFMVLFYATCEDMGIAQTEIPDTELGIKKAIESLRIPRIYVEVGTKNSNFRVEKI